MTVARSHRAAAVAAVVVGAAAMGCWRSLDHPAAAIIAGLGGALCLMLGLAWIGDELGPRAVARAGVVAGLVLVVSMVAVA